MEPVIRTCSGPKPAGAPPLLIEELHRAEYHDLTLVRIDAGQSRPPHPYVAGDSFMLVLEGELDLLVDGRVFPLQSGQLALVPRGATRGFTSGSAGATFLAGHLRG